MTQLTEFSATSVELEEVIQYFTQVLQGIKGNQVSINKRDDTTNIIATGPTGFSSVEIQHIGNPTAYQCKVSTQSSSDAMNIDEVARKLPFTPSEMREFASYMPLLKTLPFAYGDQPLAGKHLIFTIHHMSDFIVMTEIAHRLGVRYEDITVIDKLYGYKFSDRVDGTLRINMGIPVHSYEDLETAVSNRVKAAEEASSQIVVIVDGGYIAPLLLTDYSKEIKSGLFLGVVEQTRSGVWKVEAHLDNGSFPLPFVSVAETRIKALLESPLVARSAVQGIERLIPNEDFQGQNVLVVGYGSIGENLAKQLKDRGMKVFVFDTDPLKRLAAQREGFTVAEDLPSLIIETKPSLVIGCAGKSSFGKEEMLALPNSCYLASTTSRDWEFDKKELAILADKISGDVKQKRYHIGNKTLTLLADGFPVNFEGGESMPNRSSDLVLSMMLLGAIRLSTEELQNGQIPDNDDFFEASFILRLYEMLTRPGAQIRNPVLGKEHILPSSSTHFDDLSDRNKAFIVLPENIISLEDLASLGEVRVIDKSIILITDPDNLDTKKYTGIKEASCGIFIGEGETTSVQALQGISFANHLHSLRSVVDPLNTPNIVISTSPTLRLNASSTIPHMATDDTHGIVFYEYASAEIFQKIFGGHEEAVDFVRNNIDALIDLKNTLSRSPTIDNEVECLRNILDASDRYFSTLFICEHLASIKKVLEMTRGISSTSMGLAG